MLSHVGWQSFTLNDKVLLVMPQDFLDLTERTPVLAATLVNDVRNAIDRG